MQILWLIGVAVLGISIVEVMISLPLKLVHAGLQTLPSLGLVLALVLLTWLMGE
jgi:hypothetical protein